MEFSNLITDKINQLINLLLTDGVQPSDLADNIFLNEYENISYTKLNGMVIGELVFTENIEQREITTKLRYYYRADKKVVRIEEESFNNTKVIWDRESYEEKILNELLSLLAQFHSKAQINNFVSTLPEELKLSIKEKVPNLIA
ncbi:MAG TPA: hypothetical protein VE710_11890 [Candidatus Bathyarchaeia archaeon]|nr:hypothetical protein [Candidatus Bathyarchaeia archaeon]